jgi:hypothetical protein
MASNPAGEPQIQWNTKGSGQGTRGRIGRGLVKPMLVERVEQADPDHVVVEGLGNEATRLGQESVQVEDRGDAPTKLEHKLQTIGRWCAIAALEHFASLCLYAEMRSPHYAVPRPSSRILCHV